MNVKKILAAVAVVLVSVPMMGQDLLARQAPVDKRMKSIDSISLHRMLPMMYELPNLQTPSADVYPEWNNQKGRNYGGTKPSEYKIDLRHFCMPCDSRLVTSHFGYRPQFGRNHYGTDIKLYVGDTVRAVFSGKVRIVSYEAKGYGNYVILRHDNGLETVYGHMSKHLCKENQVVRAGEPIGLGGNTGRSTGSHLHFETRFYGEYINPELLFNFQAMDAKGDYYVYRSNGKSQLIGNSHPADVPVQMMAQRSTSTREVASVGERATTSRAARLKEVEETAVAEQADELSAAEKKALARAEKKKAADEKKKKEAEKKKKEAKRNYTVKQGDTLYSLARKHDTTVEKLCKLNHISESAVLRPGQILRFS